MRVFYCFYQGASGARAFLLSFLSEKLCVSRALSRVPREERISFLCVCVGGSFISFFLRTNPRARVLCVLLETTMRRRRRRRRRRRHARDNPLAPTELIIYGQDDLARTTTTATSFYSHSFFFNSYWKKNRRKHPSHWRRQAHVENRSDFVQH